MLPRSYLSSMRGACKTELDRPEPPCPTCGHAAREIFADVDTWTFSDVQTGIKATTSGRLPDRAWRLSSWKTPAEFGAEI